MLEFMKLGFAQIAFGGESGGGGGDDSSSRAPTTSPRPTPRPTPPPPPPRDDSDDDRRRQEEANRQAMLAAQMQQEQRGRAAQEAAAVEAERQRQAAAQAEANRQAQAAREAAARQAQAAAQAEANRQAQAAREAAERQRQQQEAARRMEEQQRQEDEARTGIQTLATPRDDTFVQSITNVRDVLPRTGITTVDVGTIAPPTGALTPAQAAAQAAGIQEQRFTYQDMLSRAQAPTPLPVTPAPIDYVPSIDLRDESGSVLPPPRDLAGTVSIGYGPGQVDPSLAQAADLREGQPAFGQTTGGSTLEQLYGPEIPLTEDTLADMTLASGRFDETQQLLQARPDLVLPPSAPDLINALVVPTGQVPVGTPGAQAPRDLYMVDEVQTLLDASPQARTVYQDMGITRTPSIDIAGDPNAPRYSYRDAAGRQLSAQQVADALRAAPTTTLPGGYMPIAPLDMTSPIAPVIDLGLTPVDIATPVTVTGAPGRGDPRDFGFSAEEAAAAARRAVAPAGIENLLERSPTAGRPAASTVPTAFDVDEGQVEANRQAMLASQMEQEQRSRAAQEAAAVAAEKGVDAAVDVGTGTTKQVEEAKASGYGYDMNGDGRVSIVEILTDMTNGGGPGQPGDQFEGGGILSRIGNALGGPGDGTGVGAGDGSGTGEDREPDVEVEIPDEDAQAEEPVVEEPEEPAFECPPGFRRVQMPNGGFTCVPQMVRPRVGPYTQPVSVAPLAGRTPFRPGTRRA